MDIAWTLHLRMDTSKNHTGHLVIAAAHRSVFCRERNALSGVARPAYRDRMAALIPLNRSSRPAPAPEPLWREVLGARLRELRQERGDRLVDAAARAGVSPQYLSEVERGQKDASSEMIAAMAGALEVTVLDLVSDVVAQSAPAGSSGRSATASVRAYALAA